MRFLHLADLHLGFQQYGSAERNQDFARGLETAVDYGLDASVDAILIAGDLFHRATIDPSAYIQATGILRKTRERGIPVIAIEGNHDAARHRDESSWLDVLCQEGYLNLLRTPFTRDGCCLPAWNPETRAGAYLDIHNVRFIGFQWTGATAALRIPEVAEAIKALPPDQTNCNVLLSHAALEGEIPNMPVYLTLSHLDPLRECVQYLALGHIHKRYDRGNWIYNPGCPEIYDLNEVSFEKGWYDVEVSPGGQKTVRFEAYDHRPFFIHSLQVSMCHAPHDLYRVAQESIRAWALRWKACPEKPVVIVRLEGRLAFERQDLDTSIIKKFIQDEECALLYDVREDKLRLPGIEIADDESLSQEELERYVFQELALNNAAYAGHSEEWARIMQTTMQMALEKKSLDDILEVFQTQFDLEQGA